MQKPDGRGGARPGAGRKIGQVGTISAQQVERMLRAARKYRKKYGKSIDEVLLGFIYGEPQEVEVASKKDDSVVKLKVTPKFSDRVTSIKVFKEYTIAKMQEGGETDKALGPAVFLPEQRPQLTVVSKKESA